MRQETDLNEEIRRLKTEGKSLREMGTTLGISHVAVLKRLRAIEIGREMVTSDRSTGLPSVPLGDKKVVTVSDPCVSKEPQESEEAVNQVVTSPPSHDKGVLGNPPGDTFLGPSEAVADAPVDLCGAIKEFLHTKGIEVYRMQVGQEAYQVEHKGQVLRMYVHQK